MTDIQSAIDTFSQFQYLGLLGIGGIALISVLSIKRFVYVLSTAFLCYSSFFSGHAKSVGDMLLPYMPLNQDTALFLAPFFFGFFAALTFDSAHRSSTQKASPSILLLCFCALLCSVAVVLQGTSIEAIPQLLPKLFLCAFIGACFAFLALSILRTIIAMIPVMLWSVVLLCALFVLQPQLLKELKLRPDFQIVAQYWPEASSVTHKDMQQTIANFLDYSSTKSS